MRHCNIANVQYTHKTQTAYIQTAVQRIKHFHLVIKTNQFILFGERVGGLNVRLLNVKLVVHIVTTGL
jgi:hypothetical protein